MTPRRHETRLPNNQPVKFYKIVALTFLVLTVGLLAVIIFMSTKRATITITTKTKPIEINRTLEIGESSAPNSIAGVVTSTEFSLSKRFEPTGEREEVGVAMGTVILHNDSNSSQVLVATTRLLTPDNILFRLKDRVTVPAGGTLEAEVYADQEGSESEIDPVERFSIPGLSEASQKLIYASSNEPMVGGVKKIGILSEDDIRKAEKILIDEVTEEAKEYFTALFPDKTYILKISDEKEIDTDKEVGEEVSEYNMTLKTKVEAVFYEESDLLNWSNEMLMKRAIDDSENVESSGETPTVTLEEADENKAVVSVIYTGMANINPESEQLDKAMFFGKTKEEVRKYLLSLDHVHSVEIDFRPAWMRTVPHVADHVSVVIKSVE